MRVIISATGAGLARAAMHSRAGDEVRVLRVGALRGLGAAPVDDAGQLAALRALWGPLAWVPAHARRLLLSGGRERPLGRFSRLGLLDGFPGLHPRHRGGWVCPARGWRAAEQRQIALIQRAGGDVVDAEVEELEVEDGRVVGVSTTAGFEWVDRLETDVDPNTVLEWMGIGARRATRMAEVEVEGKNAVDWEMLVTDGPVFRIRRDLVHPERVTVHLRDPERARHQAIEALAGRVQVAGVREVRIAPVGWDEAAARKLAEHGVEVLPPLV